MIVRRPELSRRGWTLEQSLQEAGVSERGAEGRCALLDGRFGPVHWNHSCPRSRHQTPHTQATREVCDAARAFHEEATIARKDLEDLTPDSFYVGKLSGGRPHG